MLREEVSLEEEEEVIEKVSQAVAKLEMGFLATIFLGSILPLAYIGGQLGRFYLSPFYSIIGESPDLYLAVFEKRENIQKLMERIEELEKKEKEEKRKKDKTKRRGSFLRFLGLNRPRVALIGIDFYFS